jgi:hypothetical protein
MNKWYSDNIDNIDRMFNSVSNFINYYNIELKVDHTLLYEKFVTLAFKTSHIPFKQINYSFYRVNKTYYNDYYELNIGIAFFDLLTNIKTELEDYDKNFLGRLHIYAIKNFFEKYFVLTKYNNDLYINKDTHINNDYIDFN